MARRRNEMPRTVEIITYCLLSLFLVTFFGAIGLSASNPVVAAWMIAASLLLLPLAAATAILLNVLSHEDQI